MRTCCQGTCGCGYIGKWAHECNVAGTAPCESDVLGDHIERARAWLLYGFGGRLTPEERASIVRVMFSRAWACKSALDAQALLASIEHGRSVVASEQDAEDLGRREHAPSRLMPELRFQRFPGGGPAA